MARYYIGAGQSNAIEGANKSSLLGGYGQLADVYPGVSQVMRLGSPLNFPVWQNYGPESLQPRFDIGDPGGPRNFIGHSLTIGRGLAAYYGQNEIVVGRLGVSGTGLQEAWLPPSPPLDGEVTNLYSQLVAFIVAQVPNLNDLHGIWWTQGNNDAGTAFKSTNYAANLATFFGALRADLGRPTLKIVYDQLPPAVTAPFTDTVRAQQALYAATDPNARMIATDYTYTLRDAAEHYDAQTFMRLGWEMANAFIGQAGALGTLGNV